MRPRILLFLNYNR
uniref:Uncharacterized protein n=1 Tax=Anguilla anguilla TaxID=7936 RepID=A0A0E9V6G3_ANGAN